MSIWCFKNDMRHVKTRNHFFSCSNGRIFEDPCWGKALQGFIIEVPGTRHGRGWLVFIWHFRTPGTELVTMMTLKI